MRINTPLFCALVFLSVYGFLGIWEIGLTLQEKRLNKQVEVADAR